MKNYKNNIQTLKLLSLISTIIGDLQQNVANQNLFNTFIFWKVLSATNRFRVRFKLEYLIEIVTLPLYIK